jgi:hypothetical protein
MPVFRNFLIVFSTPQILERELLKTSNCRVGTAANLPWLLVASTQCPTPDTYGGKPSCSTGSPTLNSVTQSRECQLRIFHTTAIAVNINVKAGGISGIHPACVKMTKQIPNNIDSAPATTNPR